MYAATSGYRNDGDAGLTHVGARYYDALVGRFTSRDTYLDQKPYLYCEHDPVNGLDPSGHQDLSYRLVSGKPYDVAGDERRLIGRAWNGTPPWIRGVVVGAAILVLLSVGLPEFAATGPGSAVIGGLSGGGASAAAGGTAGDIGAGVVGGAVGGYWSGVSPAKWIPGGGP